MVVALPIHPHVSNVLGHQHTSPITKSGNNGIGVDAIRRLYTQQLAGVVEDRCVNVKTGVA